MKIVTSWDDITLKQWQELSALQCDDEVTRLIETIAIITDTDSETIRALGLKEFQQYKKDLEFLSKPISNEVQLQFDLNGKKYGMIPDLNFITAGEWQDADVWKNDPVGNVHLFCAMLYRPITKIDGDYYEIEPYQTKGFTHRSNLFLEELSIMKVHGAVVFFSNFVIEYTKNLAVYLESLNQTPKKEKTSKKTTTQKATKTRNVSNS